MKATRPHQFGEPLPDWPRTSIAEAFLAASGRSPDKVATVEGEHRLTYADLRRKALALAKGLQSIGIGQGDVVTLLLPDWWEMVVAFYAIQLRGAVANPITPIYRQSELAFIYGQAKPRAIIAPERYRGTDYVDLNQAALAAAGVDATVITVRGEGSPDGVRRLEQLWQEPGHEPDVICAVDADEICMLMYTSGTTSAAKGVLHSHATLLFEVGSFYEFFNLGPDDVIFMPSPTTHIAGLVFGVLGPVVRNQRALLLDRWQPEEARRLVEEEGCTWCLGATPFLRGLLDSYAADGSRSVLRAFACGGADVSPQLVADAEKVMGTAVVRVYGSTEYPTFSCSFPDSPLDQRTTTDGQPSRAAECILLEENDGVGELAVRGPEMFLGYLDENLNASAFTDDGFFRTGDLASLDADGHVTIRGRKKDIIIRGGENISAREVEDHLYAHPGIAEVAVVGVPDPVMGERACAYVVPAPGQQELALPDLVDFLSGRGIAKQKFPETLLLLPELPKTASGKIQKHLLRAQSQQAASGSTRQ